MEMPFSGRRFDELEHQRCSAFGSCRRSPEGETEVFLKLAGPYARQEMVTRTSVYVLNQGCIMPHTWLQNLARWRLT